MQPLLNALERIPIGDVVHHYDTVGSPVVPERGGIGLLVSSFRGEPLPLLLVFSLLR